jgi:secreted trypsin-like serine protease
MLRCTILVVLFASASIARAESNAGSSEPATGTKTSAIVGGDDVPAGKWPDTVAVLGTSGTCTGTLIAPDVVLTAGHCADLEPTTVVANTTDYASGGVRVGVTRTVAYPKWESTYDVAVVVLAKPITAVAPRRIGTSCTYQQFRDSTMVRIVGFGATNIDGTATSTKLREAMTAVTDPMCSAESGCNKEVAPGGEFVAGGTGNADSCFGDSGGPVYLETERGPIVVGAVSRGVDNSASPCGSGGIYVRTDKIVQWIEETAGAEIAKDDCAGSDYAYEEPAPQASGDLDGAGCSATRGSTGGLFVLALAGLGLWSRRRR